MEILVIGGTRFFGKLLVEQLLARGDRVTIFSRGRSRPAFWARVEHIAGDRTDRRAFTAALAGRRFDAVIDNIAFQPADVDAVLSTLADRIGHYLLTSSGSVYLRDGPPPTFVPLREDDADLSHRGGDPYADGKRGCEQAAQARGRRTPVTIIRPPVVQGPEDPTGRGWFWYQRIADGGPVLVPQRDVASIWRQAFSADVARAFVAAAGNPAAFGRTYNVAMDEIISVEDFIRLAAAILKKPEPIVTIPQEVLARQAPWYRPTFCHRFVMDTSRIKAELGFVSTPIRRWMEDTIRWHLEAQLPPSEGYARRAEEIALARRLR